MRLKQRTCKKSEKHISATWGAGFLGSHLCEQLLARSCELLCVNNYLAGRRSNGTHLMSHPLFEMMRHDITFPVNVEVDEICNLACPALPIHYQIDTVQTTKTSVHGAIRTTAVSSPSSLRKRSESNRLSSAVTAAKDGHSVLSRRWWRGWFG